MASAPVIKYIAGRSTFLPGAHVIRVSTLVLSLFAAPALAAPPAQSQAGGVPALEAELEVCELDAEELAAALDDTRAALEAAQAELRNFRNLTAGSTLILPPIDKTSAGATQDDDGQIIVAAEGLDLVLEGDDEVIYLGRGKRNRTGLFVVALRPIEFTANPHGDGGADPSCLDSTSASDSCPLDASTGGGAYGD